MPKKKVPPHASVNTAILSSGATLAAPAVGNQIARYTLAGLPNRLPLTYSSIPKRWTRLLKSQKAPSGTVAHSLVPASVDRIANGTFIALSYTWGSAVNTTTPCETLSGSRQCMLEIDGCFLEVTPNLADFLQVWEAIVQSNNPDTSYFIWIDAICINQDDLEEREDQVMLMGQIYSGATSVIIWLGASNEGVKSMRWIHGDFSRALTRALDRYGIDTLGTFDLLSGELLLDLGLHGVSLDEYRSYWSQYLKFYHQRRWFTRAWVIQEATLAKDAIVMCGTGTDTGIGWDNMIGLITIMEQTGWLQELKSLHLDDPNLFRVPRFDMFESLYKGMLGIGFQARALAPIFTNVSSSGGLEARWYAQFLMLLRHSFRYAATDGRDKIYCLLGLMSHAPTQYDTTLPRIKADYRISKNELYINLSRQFLLKLPRLVMLSEASRVPNLYNTELPSWALDFESSLVITRIPWAGSILKEHYDVWPSQSTPFSVPQFSDGCLILRGFKVDTVTDTTKATPSQLTFQTEGPSPTAQLPDIMSFLKFVQRLSAIYPQTQETRGEVIWRTLIADASDTACPAPNELGTSFRQNMVEWALKYLSRHPESITEVPQLFEDLHDAANFPNQLELEQLSLFSSLTNTADLDRLIGTQPERRKWSVPHGTRMNHKALFTTAGELVGIGPQWMQEGDELFLLEGGWLPFVLRRVGERYKLLGDAYVHGIMRGELRNENQHDMINIEIL